MTAILALLAPIKGILIAICGLLFGMLMAFLNGRSKGRQIERDRQAAAEARARDVADEVENDVGTLTPEQRRQRLKEWGKK